MFNKNVQAKILDILKIFFFCLGTFSIGMSIYLFFRESEYIILNIIFRIEALWIGIWAPTCYILSIIFDKLKTKGK
jgi:hypothetical protein